MMDINRNQYFLIGLVLLFIGIEFKIVDSFMLTADFTQFLAERSKNPAAVVGTGSETLFGSSPLQKTILSPEWVGWCVISLGAVLILHSLSMKKPGT